MAPSNRLRVSATLVAVLVATLLAAVVVGPARAAFPDRVGSIAFTSDRKASTDGVFDIYRMSGDGRGPTKKLTHVPGNNVMPAWSADGTGLAFVHYGLTGSYNIYRMAADGSGETPLINDLSLNVDPAWFPSGRKIVFSKLEDIYVMILDASGDPTGSLIRLTTNGAVDRQPVVSPDGREIAFASNRDGDFDIYVMKAAPEGSTNRPVKLTENTKKDFAPDWSPDGTRIVFSRGSDGDREIYVMKAASQDSDTNRPANLTKNAADDSDPDWSPDGERIVFVSDRTGDDEIWLMRTDGTGSINLTTKPTSEDRQPAWQPLP